jgi:hypothetical protein
MSIKDIYETTKNTKPSDRTNKLVRSDVLEKFSESFKSIEVELTAIRERMDQFGKQISALEALDMELFTKKHTNMKESHNALVTDYNALRLDFQVVTVDIGNRLKALEECIPV